MTAASVNVAYIISAYKLPELLVRLVKRLDGPGTVIYVHVDARTDAAVYDAMTTPLADYRNVHFLPRHECHWGDFGHVRATLKGLRALIAGGHAFDYVVLLTGQDYPLRSGDEIAATLGAAHGQVFMDWVPIPNELWTNGGMYRIENRYFRVGRWSLSFPGAPFGRTRLNGLWSAAARALRLQRAFPEGMVPYGGSSYWMMPADCARYVDDWVQSHPDYVRFFQHVRIPDEIFFHSIVLNSPFRNRIAADYLRHVEWEADADSPTILVSADYERLMASGNLFARKFDPHVDATVLDRIDAELDARTVER